MGFVLQVNTTDLPSGAPTVPAGLVQLYRCFDQRCQRILEGFRPDSPAQVVRWRRIRPEGLSVTAPREGALPALAITGWEPVDDHPSAEEAEALGWTVSEALERRLDDEELPVPGEKLGGWPAWPQSPEYPACRICGAPMRLFFQLGSDGLLPLQFGDDGTAFITYCPTHPTELSFHWSSG